MRNFVDCSDQDFDETYRHIPCLVLPAEASERRRYSKWVMDASMVAMDMTPEDAELALEFFNSDWLGKRPTHYCLYGSCTFGCRDEAHGLEIAKKHGRTSLGMGLVVALEYRWKGMERAAAWALRGRGLFDVLDFTLLLMFKVKDLEAAEAYCEAIGNGEISFQVKTAIKANSLINSFASDP